MVSRRFSSNAAYHEDSKMVIANMTETTKVLEQLLCLQWDGDPLSSFFWVLLTSNMSWIKYGRKFCVLLLLDGKAVNLLLMKMNVVYVIQRLSTLAFFCYFCICCLALNLCKISKTEK